MPAPDPAPDPAHTVDHAVQSATVAVSQTLPTTAPEPPAGWPRIAGYRITAEIARGGMGRIYAAVDEKFEREVAIKTLLPGANPERFVTEAKITARLPHPNIPPVYALDALADGTPYLAMKLIHGRTLERLLSSREGELPRFLQTFEQIAQAVGFAHSRGILHRDLKPLNVMVGEFGEVQVMDWGLAKDTTTSAGRDRDSGESPDDANANHTVAGAIMGTPGYMAPEQARGEVVDARADVFALGGVLCAILTGRAPFTGPRVADILRMAARGELAEAFARLAACGADAPLVALCRHCLSPAPADRPADAGELARLVAAYRAALEERLRAAERERAAAEARTAEQHKRRRVQLALAASVALLLLGGGAFAWWQDHQANARRSEAAERDRDERERLRRNRDALAAALERCEAALVEGRAETAAVALQEVQKRLPEGGAEDLDARVRQCQAELALLEELGRIDDFRWSRNDGQLQPAAVVAGRWAKAFADYGIVPGTTPPVQAAERVRGSLTQDRLLLALDLWLVLAPSPELAELLRCVDTEVFRDAARAATVARDGPRMAELAGSEEARRQPARFALALATHPNVATGLRRKLLDAAVADQPTSLALLMTRGLAASSSEAGKADKLRWYQAAVAAHPRNTAALNNLGNALRDVGDLDGAIAACKQAIRLDPTFAMPRNNLGAALHDKKDYDGALAAHQAAIELSPSTPSYRVNLGNVLTHKGDARGAAAAYREAIRLDPTSAFGYVGLGNALNILKDYEGAVAAYRESIRLDPKQPWGPLNLGIALRSQGDLDGAAAAYREAIRLDPKIAVAHNKLGIVLHEMKDHAGASAAYREAIRLDPKFAAAHNGLGHVLCDKGDLDGAIAACKEALRLHDKFAAAHNNLGNALWAKKDIGGAITAYEEAIRLDPRYVWPRNNLGLALRSKGDLDGAAAAFREALRLDAAFAPAHKNLGDLLRAQKDARGAVAAFEQAVQHDPKFAAALNALADLLATGPDDLRDGKRAVALAVRACEAGSWKDANPIDTLASAHAEAGDFDEAVKMQKRALAIPAFEKSDGPAARARLASYERKQPYRDPAFRSAPPGNRP